MALLVISLWLAKKWPPRHAGGRRFSACSVLPSLRHGSLPNRMRESGHIQQV